MEAPISQTVALTCCVYLITCLISGKQYVGKSVHKEPRTRYGQHWRDAHKGDRCPLHFAMVKYGESAFRVEKLCNTSRDRLEDMEEYWAEQLETYVWDRPLFHPPGYNAIWCGIPGHCGPHTPETKEKLRIKSTGRKASLATRVKLSIAFKGKKPAPHNLEALRVAAMRPKSDAHKQALREALLGHQLTPEQRAKQLAAAKMRIGSHATPEHCKNISNALKGKSKSEEHRVAISEAAKKPRTQAFKDAVMATAAKKFDELFHKNHAEWIADPNAKKQWRYDMTRKRRDERLLEKYIDILEKTPGWTWS